jgi:hypothetical protein
MHFPKQSKALVMHSDPEEKEYTDEQKAAVMQKLTDLWVENPNDIRLEQLAVDIRTNGRNKKSSGSHRIANMELVRLVEGFIDDWCRREEEEDDDLSVV